MTAGVGERSDSGHTEVFFFYFFLPRINFGGAALCDAPRRAWHGVAWQKLVLVDLPSITQAKSRIYSVPSLFILF